MHYQSFKDCPCDVTLVVEGGKEFRGHRILLSEASPFFDRLLKSDMKESREGVIRLEQFSEPLMKDILDFIYTGRAQISLENAEELITAADFLILPDLESFVTKSLTSDLTPSNCLSIFYMAERNHLDLEELTDETSKFIHTNFAAVGNSEEFMSLPFEEVERWITSDGLFNVTHDDIFSIVEKWVDHDKREREGKLEDLFPLVIVACGGKDTFCFLPHKAQWYRLASSKYDFKDPRQLLCLKGTLYNFSLKLFGSCFLRLSPWSAHWRSLPLPSKLFPEMVTVLDDVVYGVGSSFNGHRKFICKYNPHSNSWETIISSDVDINRGACMVGHDKYLYFMGGMPVSTVASRFDTTNIKWECITGMQQGRYDAFGASYCGKIYIAGGKQHDDRYLQTCEVYDVTTDEWQFIASLNVARSEASMVCYLGTLYVLGGLSKDGAAKALTVECYDQEAGEWNETTTIPNDVTDESDSCKFQACLLTSYKGFLDCLQPIGE